jgi:anion-transporting  ArsA/GET3 family ATPase
MSGGFRERAERVQTLLGSPRTGFVLVTSPRWRAISEVMAFHHRLLDTGLPFSGVVVNRVHVVGGDATTEGLAGPAGPELTRKVADSLADNRRLAEGDHANLQVLRRRLGRKPMIEVPELDQEVHDLEGLQRVGGHLFGTGPGGAVTSRA